MTQSFIIGRQGNQPFEIASGLVHVHGEHCRITIEDGHRSMLLEDLKGPSGNGVYVRDADGNFQRVFTCRVQPTDIIRLGPEMSTSFTFMAHHLLSPDNYSYEFGYIRRLSEKLKQEEEQANEIIRKHKTNTIVIPVLCLIPVVIFNIYKYINGADFGGIFAIVAGLGTAIIMGVRGLLSYIYRNDKDKIASIKARSKKLLTCPKCCKPLSDFEVTRCACQTCKAR